MLDELYFKILDEQLKNASKMLEKEKPDKITKTMLATLITDDDDLDKAIKLAGECRIEELENILNKYDGEFAKIVLEDVKKSCGLLLS